MKILEMIRWLILWPFQSIKDAWDEIQEEIAYQKAVNKKKQQV